MKLRRKSPNLNTTQPINAVKKGKGAELLLVKQYLWSVGSEPDNVSLLEEKQTARRLSSMLWVLCCCCVDPFAAVVFAVRPQPGEGHDGGGDKLH